jgi:hypothetical protein
MTDSTNNSFEEQWQHAFDNAELTPPESVWDKIELGLKPENTLPSKTNFSSKPYYFLGGIVVGLLGLFLWLNNDEDKRQVIENQEIKVKSTIVENKSEISPIVVELAIEDKNHRAKKVVGVVGEDTNHGAENLMENYTMQEPLSASPQTTIPEETPIRTLTDSVEMIEPLATKSIHSEIENPTINLPADQTPYYVKPLPKSQKKSILKNVKISMGAGVYQQ